MSSSTQPRRFWTPARMALTFVALALVISIGASSCTNSTQVSNTGNSNSGAKPNSANPGNRPAAAPLPQPLPATVMNMELKTIDGKAFKLADYQGKVVLVNLWATWCGPCRSETPELVMISQEYKAKGVEFVGLTTEDPDTSEVNVKKFVKDFNVPYTIAWSDQTFAYALMQTSGQVRDSIPQSFIISRDGKILKHFIGFAPGSTPPQLRQALEAAVNL